MQDQRIEMLQQMLKENPNDPFLLYAMALEYRKIDLQQSLEWFRKVLQQHPDYLPSYYHTAALLIDLGKPQKAKEIYQKGISLAQQQQEAHALRELRSAYQNLLLDLDEL